MFSRSDKSDEAATADVVADPSPQRGPMVMAMLAGLLALAGAFLLVWYMSNGSDEVAEGEAEAAAAADTRQVLVVDQTIPAGTSVQSIKDQATFYLRARAVPADFVAASAITDIAQFDDLLDLTLSSEALPGEQLLLERFVNRSDFDSEAFIERVTAVDAPDGHHQIVLTLPAGRALGGNLRAGDRVTVISSFRAQPINRGGTTEDGEARVTLDAYEVSTVILNTVEVVNVESVGDVFFGDASTDAEFVGVANQGSFQVTVAVEPKELTLLTYAMDYGKITLAAAIPGTSNDDVPGVASTINEILGEEGVLAEPGGGTSLFGDREAPEVTETDEGEDGDSSVEATPASESDVPPADTPEGEGAVGPEGGDDDGSGES